MSVPGLRREDFPVLDRLTYLNTASAGLVPASVVTPAHEFELELAQAGTTGMDEDTEIGILEDARHRAAARQPGHDRDRHQLHRGPEPGGLVAAARPRPERGVLGGGLPQRHL